MAFRAVGCDDPPSRAPAGTSACSFMIPAFRPRFELVVSDDDDATSRRGGTSWHIASRSPRGCVRACIRRRRLGRPPPRPLARGLAPPPARLRPTRAVPRARPLAVTPAAADAGRPMVSPASPPADARGYFRWPTLHGDTLAFVCEDDLYAVSASGGVPRRLTDAPGLVRRPRVSPDGASVAFAVAEDACEEILRVRRPRRPRRPDHARGRRAREARRVVPGRRRAPLRELARPALRGRPGALARRRRGGGEKHELPRDIQNQKHRRR